LAGVAAERSAPLVEAARERGTELAETARERGAELADTTRKRAGGRRKRLPLRRSANQPAWRKALPLG
jgi:hypothetical protein